jgi:hypothetical protein
VLVTMSSARIIYTLCPDATPQGGLNALADIYRTILFENSVSKEAEGRLPSPDGRDGTTVQGDSANAIIRQ